MSSENEKNPTESPTAACVLMLEADALADKADDLRKRGASAREAGREFNATWCYAKASGYDEAVRRLRLRALAAERPTPPTTKEGA